MRVSMIFCCFFLCLFPSFAQVPAEEASTYGTQAPKPEAGFAYISVEASPEYIENVFVSTDYFQDYAPIDWQKIPSGRRTDFIIDKSSFSYTFRDQHHYTITILPARLPRLTSAHALYGYDEPLSKPYLLPESTSTTKRRLTVNWSGLLFPVALMCGVGACVDIFYAREFDSESGGEIPLYTLMFGGCGLLLSFLSGLQFEPVKIDIANKENIQQNKERLSQWEEKNKDMEEHNQSIFEQANQKIKKLNLRRGAVEIHDMVTDEMEIVQLD